MNRESKETSSDYCTLAGSRLGSAATMSRGFEQIENVQDRYECITEVGDGTYGTVMKCRDIRTNETVALKKIKILNKDESFAFNTIREISLLLNLQHVNIIELKSVFECISEHIFYLVFEYCEFDLYAILYMPHLPPFPQEFYLSIIQQLLIALHFCAIKNVAHRDLKPANLFLTRDNILKLGDFGLARKLVGDKFSDKVITLWYRPPELLFGARYYGPEVDIWSAGCIIYEILVKKPLFIAKKSIEPSQLSSIFELCGTPNDSNWPDARKLPGYTEYDRRPNRLPEHLNQVIPREFSGAIDLIQRMLTLDPRRRITAEDCLNHPFLSTRDRSISPYTLQKLTIPEIHQKKASEEKRNRSARSMEHARPDAVIPPAMHGTAGRQAVL